MRFCLLSTFYPPANFGGDGIQVQRLARALAAHGHEVTVVHSPAAYRHLAGKAPTDADPPDPRIAVVGVDADVGVLAPLANYLSGRPLITRRRLAALLAGDFDVVHFHNASLLGAPGLLRMGDALKLYTAHEHWLVCPMHTLLRYGREVCHTPTCWRCAISYRRPPQLWRSTALLERCVGELDALIVLSEASAALHGHLSEAVRIERMPNFVDLDHDQAEAHPPLPAPDERYFLFAGRLEPIKGVHTLVEAFRERTETLIIAGDGSAVRRLRRQAADVPNVRMLGWVRPQELDVLYRQAIAVLVASIGHETFGVSTIEGLARGTPAIVRDFGAQAETVVDSGAGLTYRSQVELQAALDRLAGDHELRDRLGQRGREAYERRWSPQAHLRDYFNLIEQLARERGDVELAARAAEAGRQAQPAGGVPERR